MWVIPQKVSEASSKDSYLKKSTWPLARANFPFTLLSTMQKAAGVDDNRRQN